MFYGLLKVSLSYDPHILVSESQLLNKLVWSAYLYISESVELLSQVSTPDNEFFLLLSFGTPLMTLKIGLVFGSFFCAGS